MYLVQPVPRVQQVQQVLLALVAHQVSLEQLAQQARLASLVVRVYQVLMGLQVSRVRLGHLELQDQLEPLDSLELLATRVHRDNPVHKVPLVSKAVADHRVTEELLVTLV